MHEMIEHGNGSIHSLLHTYTGSACVTFAARVRVARLHIRERERGLPHSGVWLALATRHASRRDGARPRSKAGAHSPRVNERKL